VKRAQISMAGFNWHTGGSKKCVSAKLLVNLIKPADANLSVKETLEYHQLALIFYARRTI